MGTAIICRNKREGMIMKLKSIFLDIDNTLLDFDAAAQQSMEESFHKIWLVFSPGDDEHFQ